MDERSICVAKAIVSCHETFPPTPRPRYGQIAVLRDGPGKSLQVTFGAHQATDRADSLDKIIRRFRELAIDAYGDDWDEKTLADELAEYLPELAKNTPESCASLARDPAFRKLLERSAGEPLMAQAQDDVFDVHYMRPAIAAVEGSGWSEPLTLAVVYDSMIHGSWERLRDKVHEKFERPWIRSYVATRHFHLAHAGSRLSVFGNPLLKSTTYRMRTFQDQIALQNWGLLTEPKPIRTGNGAFVTEADVDAWRHSA